MRMNRSTWVAGSILVVTGIVIPIASILTVLLTSIPNEAGWSALSLFLCILGIVFILVVPPGKFPLLTLRAAGLQRANPSALVILAKMLDDGIETGERLVLMIDERGVTADAGPRDHQLLPWGDRPSAEVVYRDSVPHSIKLTIRPNASIEFRLLDRNSASDGQVGFDSTVIKLRGLIGVLGERPKTN